MEEGVRIKAQDRSVKDWIVQIRSKKLALPRFQRFEAWGPTIITDFLTSIIRELPVGVCLILEVGSKPQFHFRYFHGVPDRGENVKELLLDGQQRLTALWRCLTDSYEDKMYLLDLDTQEDKDISAICISRWIDKKSNKKYPLWVDDPKDCWARKKIPFRILNPDNGTEYFHWTEKATDGDPSKKDGLLKQVIDLREKISTFNMPYLHLPSETNPDVAIDVFVKLNTTYVRLTAFDIIVAQVEEATDQSLHQKVRELENEVPEISDYIDTSNYVLSVAALLQDKMPNQRGFFSLDLEQMILDWEKIIKGTRELVPFLEEQRIYDNQRLPTETILAPIAAIFAESPDHPDKRGNIKLLLKTYLWRAFLTERYDRSIPSRILQDFRAIKNVINEEGGYEEIPVFDERDYPLPNEELLENAGWPKKKDRLARAILLLSLREGAKDFADRSEINRKNIKIREYHHLYPDNFLKKKGFNEKEIFKALNCALITWKTNRVILDKNPLEYLLERANASILGEEEIKSRLRTHSIDHDELKSGDYVRFIEKRAKDMRQVIKNLCGHKIEPKLPEEKFETEKVKNIFKKEENASESNLKSWMRDKIELWCRIYNEGRIVSKERLHEIWKEMGKDVRGLGGFFVGKRASLVWTSDKKVLLTNKAGESIKRWTGKSISEYAKKFKK